LIIAKHPFTQIPDWVIDADISHGAFRLYCVYMSYTEKGGMTVFPGRSKLAERLNVDPRSITRWTAELEKTGLIKVKKRYVPGTKEQRSNEVTLITKK